MGWAPSTNRIQFHNCMRRRVLGPHNRIIHRPTGALGSAEKGCGGRRERNSPSKKITTRESTPSVTRRLLRVVGAHRRLLWRARFCRERVRWARKQAHTTPAVGAAAYWRLHARFLVSSIRHAGAGVVKKVVACRRPVRRSESLLMYIFAPPTPVLAARSPVRRSEVLIAGGCALVSLCVALFNTFLHRRRRCWRAAA